MSLNTAIQWSDDTVNPVMGCSVSCELRPTQRQIEKVTVDFFHDEFPSVDLDLVEAAVWQELGKFNSTETFQQNREIAKKISAALDGNLDLGAIHMRAMAYETTLKMHMVCYAHQLHLRYSTDITRPSKKSNSGYAPQFEQVTKFPGRMAQAAGWPDLFGKIRPAKPWLDFLPRLIFVSDMGDSLSPEIGFEYLEEEIVKIVTSAAGTRHLWLWLTKHPKRMAGFGRWLKDRGRDWPQNLVAMTTVTSPRSVWRAEALQEVPSRFKGLSVEPLWSSVELPLERVDWCIGGGQSGDGSKPFNLAWAQNLREQCLVTGTSFFLKQLGSNACQNGQPVKLHDRHGGDWTEWPREFRVREIPAGFYEYRTNLMFRAEESACSE